jgi:hypothetical protein
VPLQGSRVNTSSTVYHYRHVRVDSWESLVLRVLATVRDLAPHSLHAKPEQRRQRAQRTEPMLLHGLPALCERTTLLRGARVAYSFWTALRSA